MTEKPVKYTKIARVSMIGGIAAIFLSGFMTAVLVLSGDSEKSRTEPGAASVYTGILYTFEPGTEEVLESARPVRHPENIAVEDALTLLAGYLEKTYFGKTPRGDDSLIHFDIEKIYYIGESHPRRRIAVIEMEDQNKIALRHFFQGSFGGQTTFYMIAANFLQAQSDPPLLDGLILNYNGNAFPQMDHIDFTGIVTPASVRKRALLAVAGSKGIGN
ncbi:MAG: hypothetical protein R6U50_17165 [Desulfobacterales bacterium]